MNRIVRAQIGICGDNYEGNGYNSPEQAARRPRAAVTSPPQADIPSWLLRAVMHGLDRVMLWHEIARERQVLQTLDDRMLHDLGLNRADVERECRRSFWDIGERAHTRWINRGLL